MTTGHNKGRIVVWPTHADAQASDTADSKVFGRMTIWPTYAQARAHIGVGAPDWVPEGAKIHIDLVRAFNEQDAAWVDGVGVVAVDTLLGSDANTENAFGASEYDPEKLVADGYVSSGVYLALIGAARSSVLDQATVRFQIKNVDPLETNPNGFISIVAADGNDAVDVDILTGGDVWMYSWGGDLDTRITGATNSGTEGFVNAVALTITGTRLEFAVNGSNAASGVLGEDDRPSGNPFVAVVVSPHPHALQSFTIHDPLPNATGLSELSEI